MAPKAISRKVHRQVRDRARNRCEYCQHPAEFRCAPFVCEHILPRAKGAGNTLPELAWACAGCNGHKSVKTHARDWKSGRVVALFNPRRQRWSRHFEWSEDGLFMQGRTATGRATVAAVKLNRSELINLPRALRAFGVYPPAVE
jgi:hypothetical protein